MNNFVTQTKEEVGWQLAGMTKVLSKQNICVSEPSKL